MKQKNGQKNIDYSELEDPQGHREFPRTQG